MKKKTYSDNETKFKQGDIVRITILDNVTNIQNIKGVIDITKNGVVDEVSYITRTGKAVYTVVFGINKSCDVAERCLTLIKKNE